MPRRRETSHLRIDLETHYVVRFLVEGNQEAARRIDGETPRRSSLSRYVLHVRHRPLGCVDGVPHDAVVPSVGPVEETSVGMDLDFRRRAVALEIFGQRRFRLQFLEGSLGGVVGESRHRVAHFADYVRKASLRMEGHMPWTRPWRRLGQGRVVGGKRAFGGIEAIDHDAIQSQIRDKGEAVVG